MMLHISITKRGENMWGIPWESARTQWYYVPNLFSAARILASWVPAYLLVTGTFDFWTSLAVLGWFALIAATDGVDGFLARRLNQQTAWGMFIDPLGDKLLVAFSIIAILYVGWEAPYSWLLAITVWVIFAREFLLTAEIRRAQGGVVMKPTKLGKAKTAVQFVMIGTWFLIVPYAWWDAVRLVALVATLVVTIWSWAQYRRLYVTAGRIRV
jgi:CDP-diacylglycerol--glycerol-3-phosphate 3-phosphatidyltransferase